MYMTKGRVQVSVTIIILIPDDTFVYSSNHDNN